MSDVMESPICLECGDELKGRGDKKFCSDQCRNSYHNKKNRDENNLVRNINNRLRKNRTILKEMNPEGTTKVSRDELLKAGFDFNYFTSTYTTSQGKTYHYVYEQGYLELEDGKYALVIKQDYVA